MSKMSVVISITVLGVFLSPLQAQTPRGVNLAAMQGWDIVVAKDAIPSEIYVAEEFQEFFGQASGVKLPIVHRIDRWDKHVFIGPGKVMQASPVGFGVDGLDPEDLHIVVRDDNIAIAGGRPRGTLYGVYTFLEEYLGVRFLTHDHTHVPAIGQQRVVGPVDRVYYPPFTDLRYTGYLAPHKHSVFAVRNRYNSLDQADEPRFGGISPFINVNHSFYAQVPFQKYGQEHPEYFGLWDGKRMNDYVHTHLCLTNPDLVPIVTKYVLHDVGKAKRLNSPVSQNDTFWQYCQCEKCAAIDGPEESHMGALLKFVNAVADEVAKPHPDIYIGTLAYGFSRKPPKTIKPRDNVQINLCTMGRCHVHAISNQSCPRNVELMRDLKGWGRICKNLYAWDYYLGAGDYRLLPYPDLFTIKPNVNTLLAHGVKGVFMQGPYQPTAELSDLRHYLIIRLLWNPKLNDREVIDEFLNLHYGKAAPPIRRFIYLVHRHYKDTKIHHSRFVPGMKTFPVDQAVTEAGLKLFAEAMKLAESDEIKARVEKASICAYRAAIEPIWILKKDAKVNPMLAKRMRPLAKEFF